MATTLNSKITKFAEENDISREAAGMALYMLSHNYLMMDERVYQSDLPIRGYNTLWRTEHLLGILKSCERIGLL